MKKQLRRSRDNAVFLGVLGGLAEHFGHDPVLYRVAAVTLIILTGIFPGLFIYLGAWLFMPKDVPHGVHYEIKE